MAHSQRVQARVGGEFDQGKKAEREMEEVVLSSAMEESAKLRQSVIVSLLSKRPQEYIMSLMSRHLIETCYFGAREWIPAAGGASQLQAADREEARPGHCHRWTAMHLFAIVANEIGSHAGRIIDTLNSSSSEKQSGHRREKNCGRCAVAVHGHQLHVCGGPRRCLTTI